MPLSNEPFKIWYLFSDSEGASKYFQLGTLDNKEKYSNFTHNN